MYLHQLRLQAIGPFAGEHVVDFASLAASGIFLLEGPTGAGKSTLIDAVVFALYGKVASASSSDDRLRSAYAPDEVDSFVDLTFETGAGVFRVVRTPERMRRKKRGDGTTKQQAGIRLWRLPAEALVPGARLGEPGDVGELVSSRLDEAGLELQRIVGLDRTQFVQTIVLPQGEFASFLKANPEDRRGLLQKVFGTEMYERAQAQLAAMRIDAQRDIDAARAGVTNAVERFVESAALAPEEAEALREARLEHAHKLAVEHAAGMTAAADTLAAADAAAGTALAASRAALDTAKALADAHDRRTALRAEAAQLAEQEPVVEEQVRSLDAARRAAVVHPLIVGEERAGAEADDARAALDVALASATADGLAGTGPGGVLTEEALRTRRDAAAGRSASLARLVAVETGLPQRRRALAATATSLTGLRADSERRAQELALRPTERARLDARRDALRSLAGELTARTDVVARGVALVQTLDQVAALTSALDDARSGLSAAAAVAREASETESALRLRRIAGMAGEIAATLTDEDPCPVCGGVEHPAPAPLRNDHVSQDQVDAAETVRRGAETELATADRLVAQLTERLAGALEAAGGADPTSAAAELDRARRAVAEAEEARGALPGAEHDLTTFDAVTASLTDEHHELLTTITSVAARLEHDTADLAADEAEVAAAVQDIAGSDRDASAPGTVAAAVADLDRSVRTIDVLLAARARADAAERAHTVRVAERRRVMEEHGFETVDAVRAALLPAPELARLEGAVTAYRSALDRVRDGLAEARVAQLPETVDVDLDAARVEVEEAEAVARHAAGEATLAASRARSAASGADSIAAAAATLETVEASAEPVVRMANLATGSTTDNAKRLTLATFVLMRRFEDVVAAANERIAVMSDGRYELERSDDKEAGKGHKVGLALRVLDHRTGAPRLASSLSGGETFYVSLCLALGMADVVMAEAGGVELGTLFVDEGFGSLDPETLDSVLHVLGGLRAGGRVVGVVSHVETLKQTISDGISVRRLPDGSSTLTVRAG